MLPARLESLVEVRLDGGLPVGSVRLLPPTGSCSRERYRHEGGRLAFVEEDGCDAGGGLETVVKEIVYGQDGRVTGIDAIGPGGRRPVWRRGEAPHTGRRSGARRPAGAPPPGLRLRTAARAAAGAAAASRSAILRFASSIISPSNIAAPRPADCASA